MREVRNMVVDPAEGGVRLDRWFRRRWPHLTQGQLHKLIRSGQVRIDGVPTTGLPPRERARLLAAFLSAAQQGDLETLEGVLAAGIVSISDGGGVVPAARKIVAGPERVAHFLLGVLEKYGQGMSARAVEINGEPAVLAVRPDGSAIAIWTIDAASDGIQSIFMVLNPRKLSRFGGPVALS